MKKLTRFMLWLVFVVLLPQIVNAEEVLYGVDRTSALYTIDPTTGAAVVVGPLGFEQATALAADPTTGQLYATPGGGGKFPQEISGCLYSVSKETGSATLIGCDLKQGGNDPFPGFSFHSNGTLYGIRFAGNAAPYDSKMHLTTLDLTTGDMVDIGIVGSRWGGGFGLAFVPCDVLYTWDTYSGLSSLSLTDGSPTIIGYGDYFGFPGDIDIDNPRIPAMDYSNEEGMLYGILVNGWQGEETTAYYLVTINTTTGDVTNVAALPSGMQNLAFTDEGVEPAAGVKEFSAKGNVTDDNLYTIPGLPENFEYFESVKWDSKLKLAEGEISDIRIKVEGKFYVTGDPERWKIKLESKQSCDVVELSYDYYDGRFRIVNAAFEAIIDPPGKGSKLELPGFCGGLLVDSGDGSMELFLKGEGTILKGLLKEFKIKYESEDL